MDQTAMSPASAPGVRRIDDLDVAPIAYGTAGLVFTEGMDDAGREASLRAAIESGFTVFDTALAYSWAGEPHSGERFVADALRRLGVLDEVTLVTKGGHFRTADGGFPIDGRPEAIHEHCRGSLDALGVDRIDLYLLHWPDPAVPIEDSVGALRELQEAGLVRRIGLSNVTIDQLQRASGIARISAVQNRYLLGGDEDAMLAHTQANGIGYLGYSPLGLVDDWAAFSDRPDIAEILTRTDTTAQQLVMAWLLARGPGLVPVSGATRPSTVRATAAAASLELAPSDIDTLTAALVATTPR
jgi:aryl-alcohol dehydrogenase-like predicted oxidoreductase